MDALYSGRSICDRRLGATAGYVAEIARAASRDSERDQRGALAIGYGCLQAVGDSGRGRAVLVFVQGFLLFVFLCLGAGDAAALPLRPANEFRVEIAVAGGDCESGDDGVYRDGAEPMSVELVLFFTCAILAMAGGLLLIFLREPIHSALALILVMISLAVLYLLLGAEFIAAIQIIVYAGAIMVLFVFVIMLLNAGEEERTNISRIAKYVGVPLGIFLTGELAWVIYGAIGKMLAAPSGAVSTRELSLMLFQTYVFPFEATSILILIAILGAVVLAKRDF